MLSMTQLSESVKYGVNISWLQVGLTCGIVLRQLQKVIENIYKLTFSNESCWMFKNTAENRLIQKLSFSD